MDRLSLELNGTWFELQLADELTRRFPDCIVLHDLNLHSFYLSMWKNRNTDTQVDLILITPYKIYVIEAKKWGFEISGSRDDTDWVGRANGNLTIHQKSPINQNLMHLRELKNLVRRYYHEKLPEFSGYVCVPNGTRIVSNCEEVVTASSLFFRIRSELNGYKSGRKTPSMLIDASHWEAIIANALRNDSKRKY